MSGRGKTQPSIITIQEVRGLDYITFDELEEDNGFFVVNHRRLKGQREAIQQFRFRFTELKNYVLNPNDDGVVTIQNYSFQVDQDLGPGQDGYVLTYDGATGIGSFQELPAGGNNTEVQYNNAGAFAGSPNMTFDGTTLTITSLTVDNLSINGNTIQSTSGNLILTPNGDLILNSLIWPSADGSVGQVLQTDGAGNLSFAAAAGTVDLSYTAGTRTITNTGGTNAVITIFTDSDPGLVSASGGGTSNFLRADGSWAVPAGSTSEGTHTATYTAVNNIDSVSTNGVIRYVRFGDWVMVYGSINVDHTANATTEFRMDLPFASSLSSVGQLTGTATMDDNFSVLAIQIYADTSNNEAFFRYYYPAGPTVGAKGMYFNFVYKVV